MRFSNTLDMDKRSLRPNQELKKVLQKEGKGSLVYSYAFLLHKNEAYKQPISIICESMKIFSLKENYLSMELRSTLSGIIEQFF